MNVVELYPQPISFELDALNGTSIEFLQTFRQISLCHRLIVINCPLVWAITVLCSVVIIKRGIARVEIVRACPIAKTTLPKLVHQPCGSLQSSLIAIIQLLLVVAHNSWYYFTNSSICVNRKELGHGNGIKQTRNKKRVNVRKC